ncbi:MAG: hypothetical protein H8F28_17835 [Fibrella sp.]|nr:hypothetical protein [Armatimonadota bacterium]
MITGNVINSVSAYGNVTADIRGGTITGNIVGVESGKIPVNGGTIPRLYPPTVVPEAGTLALCMIGFLVSGGWFARKRLCWVR